MKTKLNEFTKSDIMIRSNDVVRNNNFLSRKHFGIYDDVVDVLKKPGDFKKKEKQYIKS